MYKDIKNKKQLYDVLTNVYDVEEKTASIIIDNLVDRHHFSESEEILLESHDVPLEFIKELENNKYLFKETNKLPKPISLVGPFFYIDNKIIGHTKMMKDYDNKERFYNDPISHFDFFSSLGIDGDYGNYPRGRVIYDSGLKKFIVYMDKSLMKEDIKNLVIVAFLLVNESVIFKKDSHYTHDWM